MGTIKKIFFRAATFSFLLILIIFFGQNFLSIKKYEQKIKHNIEEYLSASYVDFSSMKINFLPTYAHIKRINVQYATSGYENITFGASSLKIKFSFISLLNKKIKIKEVNFYNPTIVGNQYDIKKTFLTTLKNTQQLEKIKKLKNLSFVNGHINFSNLANADKINGSINFDNEKFDLQLSARHKSGKILSLSASNKSSNNKKGVIYRASFGDCEFSIKATANPKSSSFNGIINGAFIEKNKKEEKIQPLKVKTLENPYSKNKEKNELEKAKKQKKEFINGKILGTIKEDSSISYNAEGSLLYDDTLNGNFSIDFENKRINLYANFDYINFDTISDKILVKSKDQKSELSLLSNLTEGKLIKIISDSMDKNYFSDLFGDLNIKIKNLVYNKQSIKNTSISTEIKEGLISNYKFQSYLPHNTKIKNTCSKSEISRNLICYFDLISNNAKEFMLWATSIYPSGLDNPENTMSIKAKTEFSKNLFLIDELNLKANETLISANAIVKKLKEGTSAIGNITTTTNSLPSFVTTLLNKLDVYQKKLNKKQAVTSLHSLPIFYDFNILLSEKLTSKNKRPHFISFSTKYRNKTFRIDRVDINYENILKAKGDLKIGIDKLDAFMNSNIEILELDIDKVGNLSMVEFKSKENPKLLSLIDKVSEILSKPTKILKDGTIKLSISELKSSGTNIGNIETKIKILDKAIDIDYLRGKIFDGDLNYKSKTTLTNDRTTTVGNFVLNSANCAEIYKALSGENKIESYCSIGGIFNSNNTKKTHWLENLGGKMQWTSIGTKTPIMDFELIAKKILGIKTKSELISLLDTASLRQKAYSMGSVSGASEINKGILISKFRFEDEGLSGSGISQIMLKNMNTNNKIRFSIMPYDSVSTIVFDLELKGSFSDRVESSFDYNQMSKSLRLD